MKNRQTIRQTTGHRGSGRGLTRGANRAPSSSPIRPDLLERAVAVLGCRFRQNYASTETGPLPIRSLSPRDHDPARGRLATAVPFDDERALDAVATIWQKAIYWRAEPG